MSVLKLTDRAKKGKPQMSTLYLNSDGSKWIEVDSNYSRAPMDFMLILADGTTKKRRADCYAQFGNFATVEFRLKGVRYGGFFSNFEQIDGLPVLRRYSRRYTKKQQELIQIYEKSIREQIDAPIYTEWYNELMLNRIIDVPETE